MAGSQEQGRGCDVTLPNDGSVLWGPRRDQNGDFRRMLLGGGGLSVPLPAPRPDQRKPGRWLRLPERGPGCVR